MCDAVRWAGALLTVGAPCPPSYRLSRRTCARLRPAGETGEPASLPRAEVSPALTLQVHLVQLSTTQVSFSAKKRPSCQQADMFLVLGGPPMSSQRTWLSLDWKIEGNVYVWAEATSSSRSQTGFPQGRAPPARVAPPAVRPALREESRGHVRREESRGHVRPRHAGSRPSDPSGQPTACHPPGVLHSRGRVPRCLPALLRIPTSSSCTRWVLSGRQWVRAGELLELLPPFLPQGHTPAGKFQKRHSLLQVLPKPRVLAVPILPTAHGVGVIGSHPIPGPLTWSRGWGRLPAERLCDATKAEATPDLQTFPATLPRCPCHFC